MSAFLARLSRWLRICDAQPITNHSLVPTVTPLFPSSRGKTLTASMTALPGSILHARGQPLGRLSRPHGSRLRDEAQVMCARDLSHGALLRHR